VEVISRQARRLARLTDDLLDVSRIAYGKLALEKCLVDMSQVLRRAAESSRGSIVVRGHELTLKIGDGSHTVDGDPARLEQVVCNLLENAAKFTDPEGKICAALESQDARVVLRVKDTGVGIDRELLSRVFDKYIEGGSALDGRGGLGIGLSLVRGLVEMHGGRVEALSEGPSRGSEFVVTLPRAAEQRLP
jgi:signal transduction histidine kinase